MFVHVYNIKCDGSWVISDGSWVTHEMGQWVTVNSNDPLPALPERTLRQSLGTQFPLQHLRSLGAAFPRRKISMETPFRTASTQINREPDPPSRRMFPRDRRGLCYVSLKMLDTNIPPSTLRLETQF